MGSSRKQSSHKKWIWLTLGLVCAVSLLDLMGSSTDIGATVNPTPTSTPDIVWRWNIPTPTATPRIRICDCILAQIATPTPTPTSRILPTVVPTPGG